MTNSQLSYWTYGQAIFLAAAGLHPGGKYAPASLLESPRGNQLRKVSDLQVMK